MQLSSLKIIVTGAAQGMGAHFARRLAEAGAQVAAGDVKEDGLSALANPDATQRQDVKPNNFTAITYVSPLTPRLLLEGGFARVNVNFSLSNE